MLTTPGALISGYGNAVKLWLCTNVLGTAFWLLDGDSHNPLTGLSVGITAAIYSLVTIPVARYAFRAIEQLPQPQRPWVAAATIIGLFLLSLGLLGFGMWLLPPGLLGFGIWPDVDTWLFILSIASPYLVAALASAAFVYRKVLFAPPKETSKAQE